MDWLGIVFKGVTAIVGQWLEASEAERKAIEERALKAVSDMIADRNDLTKMHDERTALTLLEIEKALGKYTLDLPLPIDVL